MINLPCPETTARDNENDLITELRSKCGINLDKDSFNTYSSTRVPYNSRLGRDLRKCLDIPNPPLETVNSSLVDPPRMVDAEKWNSNYCKAWNDNQIECRKSSRYSKIECSPIIGNTPVISKKITCNEIFDINEVGKLCSNITTYLLSIDNNNAISMNVFNETNWYYEYNVASRLWSSKMFDGSNNNSIKKSALGRKLAYDYVCENTYEEENTKNIAINLGEN